MVNCRAWRGAAAHAFICAFIATIDESLRGFYSVSCAINRIFTMMREQGKHSLAERGSAEKQNVG
jgi:hypothetical protein